LQILCAEAVEACPSLWSIRNWVPRLGLYQLERPKLPGTDWALILDHTIQVGPHKAWLILGVKLGDLNRDAFALGRQKVAVLGLEIGERSNGQTVLEALEKIQEQIGEPRLLVSDAGSDIKKAAALFCERHRHTDWIPDVSHRMARLLEAELTEDPQWESFLNRAAHCRNQCRQTALSPLMPPAQRGKARWMNYQPLVSWGLEMIQHPRPSWADPRQFKKLFGWLDDYEEELGDCWMMMHLLSDTLTGAQPQRCFQQLLTAPDLKRATIYFSFYLMGTWQKFGRGDLIMKRMGFWKDLVKQGLKTPVEMPGNTRSDCHAWGSHPLFDLAASVAGVRPDSPGFRTVRITPEPGDLPKIVSRMPHPDGFIVLDLSFEGGHCRGSVELPSGITGVLVWHRQEHQLTGGANSIDIN
jgi:Bacterial alpha-L-rhamnosidase C-terminal domain